MLLFHHLPRISPPRHLLRRRPHQRRWRTSDLGVTDSVSNVLSQFGLVRLPSPFEASVDPRLTSSPSHCFVVRRGARKDDRRL